MRIVSHARVRRPIRVWDNALSYISMFSYRFTQLLIMSYNQAYHVPHYGSYWLYKLNRTFWSQLQVMRL